MNGLTLYNEASFALVSFLPLGSWNDSPVHNICLELVHTKHRAGIKCHYEYWSGILMLSDFGAGNGAFQTCSLKQKMNKL